jgi:hypothetical protein
MEKAPYYGGPEEGGWSGEDHIVVAYQEYPSKELAEKEKEKIESLAEEFNQEERRGYGDHCLRTMEWLEQKGLDADFLPEPDGPSEYYVMVTNTIPQNSYGSRQWS